MVASVLDGKSAVSVSGNVSAGSTPSNFTIQGSPADVANYARQGNDLVVQMKNGQSFTIQNFSAQGASFNNLVFAQGETVSVVNFSKAFSAMGDGIIDSLVTTQVVGAGVSTTALLGILGAAAAAGGVAVAASQSDGNKSANPVDPTDPTDPTDPVDPTNPTDPTDPTGPVDTTPPAAPTGLSLSRDTGASDTDSITNIGAQTFSGKAEAGSTVEVTISGAQFGTRVIGTVKADAAGNWSITSTVELPDGNYAVTAKATDAAGNVSPASAPLEFVLDTAVNAPTDISVLDSDGLVLGSLTNVNHIKFSGQAERGSVVTLVLDGDTIGTATVDADGIWTFDYTAQTVLDGEHELTVKATDLAGNVSSEASRSFNVDTVSALPRILMIEDTNGHEIRDGIINSNALLFSGTAEANSVVQLYLNNQYIGSASADAAGVWEFDYSATPLVRTEHTLTARATDLAGNISTVASYHFEITQLPSFGATITGDGGMGSVVIDFAKDIDPASFDISDLIVNNGSVTSFIWANTKRLMLQVAPDPSLHTNVAVTLKADSVLSSDGAPNSEARNTTTLDGLFSPSSMTYVSGDVTGWDTSHATKAYRAFYANTTFNQDISGWDVSHVTDMGQMFVDALAFNQDLGSWNISSLTSAAFMFRNTGMSVHNMDATIRGWAKLDTAAGETAIQSGVRWEVGTYTDATAIDHLQTKYGWIINGSIQNGVLVGTSGNDALGLPFIVQDQIIHGLGGDDTIEGGLGNDWLVGGAGNDILKGGGGADTFHYGFQDAGSDIIVDFDSAEGDVIHLADLLVGYDPSSSTLSDFVTAADNTFGGTILTVHYDGSGAASDIVQIELLGVGYTATLLNDLISSNNLVLA